MEQCKTDNGSYIKTDGSDCAPTTVNSPQNYYSLTNAAVLNGGDSYTLTVTRNPPGDTECSTLTLDNLGRKSYTGTAPDAHRCWGE